MNKPNSEALRRGLYVGASVLETNTKRVYKIEGFDAEGDPYWGNGDGSYARHCELVPGQQRRFQIGGGRTSVSLKSIERFRDIEVPEHLYDEALAVLAAHFEGRK